MADALFHWVDRFEHPPVLPKPDPDAIRVGGMIERFRQTHLPAIERNSTGPEAEALRRLESLGRTVIAGRRAVGELERAIAGETVQLKARPRPLVEEVVERLPRYAREVVKREGLVVPGVPGALAPKGFDPRSPRPSGALWKIKF